jgi:hypothetical protein
LSSLKYLGNLSPSAHKSYLVALRAYFRAVRGVDTERMPEPELEKLFDEYLASKPDFQSDLQTFLAKIQGNAPLTVGVWLSVVKTTLLENDVELPTRFWKGLKRRIKGNRARTVDRIPSNKELKNILLEMPLAGKALFLVQGTAGMRPTESRMLKVSDIDLAKDPAQITLRGEYTKNGNPRTTFMSREAKEFVEKWLPQRQAYAEQSAVKAKKSFGVEKVTDSNLLFPISRNVADEMWVNAVKKAGLYEKDPSTGRATLHPHSLRKWFRTRMGSVNVDKTEAITGHDGYLTGAYRRYTVEELAEFYKQNEHVLAVFSDESRVTTLRNELDQQNKLVGSTLLRMQSKSDEQDQTIRKLSSRLSEIEKVALEDAVEQVDSILERAKKLPKSQRRKFLEESGLALD